jgi:plasmid stability protein
MDEENTMANLQIKNLPDDLYSRIQSLAVQENVSFDEAVIQLLTQAFQLPAIGIVQNQSSQSMSEILKRIRSRPRVNPSNFGLPDSTVLLQEDRSR